MAGKQPNRNEAGLLRGGGRERIGVRIVEDDGGKVGVVAGEVGGEKPAESYPIGNDASARDVARGGQVVQCGGGVLGHAGCAGVDGTVACSEAAVVDGKDIEAGAVQRSEEHTSELQSL